MVDTESYFLASKRQLHENQKNRAYKSRGFFLARKMKKNPTQERAIIVGAGRPIRPLRPLRVKPLRLRNKDNKKDKKNKKGKDNKKRSSCMGACECKSGQKEPDLASYIVDCDNC